MTSQPKPTAELIAELKRDGYLEDEPSVQPSDEDKMAAEYIAIADEELVMQLLAGWDGSAGEPVYCKKNSNEEARAREALARIIRAKLHGFSGELLALAIDPKTPSPIPGMKPTRKIQFENPKRGKPSQWARELLIVGFIRREMRKGKNGKLEPCLLEAEKKFGLSRSRLHEIWQDHQKMVETWGR
jgi:hypothetical protein